VRGYLGRPELTAERVLEDPFVPGGRMYRTGDLGRFFPSGEIEFLGRRDNQVKVRGFRIELGEVEERIRHHPGVADCAVVVRDDPGGGKSLEAFVAFAEPPPPGKNADDRGNDVMRDLRDRLPGYMVPGRVVVLERLPRTPNGKLDRHALPSGPHRTAAGGEEATAARDPLEMQLVHVWERMFGVSPIGVHDNFFGLGGHSLLAVRLFHEIEQLTGKRMPLATLFQAPTVARLAEVLRHDGWVAPWSSLVSIQPGGSKPPFFGVHGVGGNILEFIDLARYVGTDQPFYGIQAQGLDGSRPRHTSVQEMATHYLKEIREFQPQGPYYIGGSSFGGLVALEMAQQLTAAGERVALLAMFDTNAPGYPRYLPTTTAWKRRLNWWRFRIDLHWSNFVAAGAGEKVQYIREKSSRLAKAQRKKVKRLYRRMRRKIQNRLLPKQILNVQRSGVQALRTYLPSPYGGKITLFRATVQPFGIHHDRTNGWEPFARGELEIIDVPGHHGAIMREPRVKALAEELVHALERARKQEEHAPVPLPPASSVSTTSTGE
jgi:thioesterase domain-containing protein